MVGNTETLRPDIVRTHAIGLVGNEEEPEVAAVFALGQNYPNPFNPITTIRFSLAESGPATLRVYDTVGRLVVTLTDAALPSGQHEVHWDASHVASGVYFYRLQQGSRSVVRSLVLLK